MTILPPPQSPQSPGGGRGVSYGVFRGVGIAPSRRPGRQQPRRVASELSERPPRPGDMRLVRPPGASPRVKRLIADVEKSFNAASNVLTGKNPKRVPRRQRGQAIAGVQAVGAAAEKYWAGAKALDKKLSALEDQELAVDASVDEVLPLVLQARTDLDAAKDWLNKKLSDHAVSLAGARWNETASPNGTDQRVLNGDLGS
jgi:hypothetical protein